MTNNTIRPLKYPYVRERYGEYAYIYYKHYIKLKQYRKIHIDTYLTAHSISKNTNRKPVESTFNEPVNMKNISFLFL